MRKAGEIISALFDERYGPGFMKTARSSAGLFSSWEELVTKVWPLKKQENGPPEISAVAVHSRIRELEHEVLLVEADHPGWIQILQTKQTELLEAVRRKYPELEIRAMAFRLSREPFSQAAYAPSSGKDTDAPDNTHEEKEVLSPYFDGDGPESKPRDEKFQAALKELEESIRKRNGY